MFKLLLCSAIFALVLSVKALHTEVKPVKSMIYKEPIAIANYNGTVYHCQDVIKTSCGNTIHCDNMTVHCIKDTDVEYL